MKKIAKYLFAALAMAATVSCAKELTEDIRPDLQLQGKSYVFKASLEAQTKTVLDENTLQVLWNGGEEGNEYIAVMEQVENTATEAAADYVTVVNKYVAKGIYEPTERAVFEKAEGVGVVGNSVFAVYPYEAALSCFVNDKALGINVNYKSNQTATANTFDPTAPVSVAYNADVEASQIFNFKNTSALLKLVVDKDSDPIYNVAVYSLAGEPISGTFVIQEETTDEGKKGSISGAKDGSFGVVTLSNNNNPLDTEIAYYIAVAPATLKDGIGIRLNNDEKQTYTISQEIKLERNKIYDLGFFSYETPAEEDWYIIGDFTDGNINSVKKTRLEEVDNNFYIAYDVNIEAGQPFKIYNASTGISYFVDSEAISASRSFGLTKGDGFGKVANTNTYDVIVGYTRDSEYDWETGISTMTFEFVDVYLAPETPVVSEYQAPEFEQIAWISDYESKLIDFGSGLITIATDNDGEWVASQQFHADHIITPYDETSGVITWVVEEEWSTKHYMVNYSNLTDGTVEIYSPSYYSYSPDAEPVFDEYGEFIPNAYWIGIDFVGGGYYDPTPVNCEIVLDPIDFSLPTPDGRRYKFSDNLGDSYILDLGTVPGKIIKARADGDNWIQDKVLAGNGYDIFQYDMYSGEISWTENGENYSILYSDLNVEEYGATMRLSSEKVDITNNVYYVSMVGELEGIEFLLPRPDKMQLTFIANGSIPTILDLGVTKSGYLAVAFDWTKHPFAGSMFNFPEFEGWYYLNGESFEDYAYEVIPNEDGKSGIISVTDYEGEVKYYKYKNYIDNNSPFEIEAAIADSESEEEFFTVTPADKLYNLFIPGETHAPGTTPIGKQWLYESDYGMSLLDLEVTKKGYIYDASYYEGMWMSSRRYTGYTVTPSPEDPASGEITFVMETTDWFGNVSATYYKIEYSNLTETTVSIFSPSYTDDPVLDENGEALTDSWGDPLYWSGIGINGQDEEWNQLPVEMTASTEKLIITYQDSGI